jgi:8-oxo-dGTP diphosphatase
MSSREIVLGVGAVVLVDDKVLLVKRGKAPCRGCWAIPGGHVEYGESLAEAAKRELYEETKIVAEPEGIIWISEILPSDCRDDDKHYIIIDFLMRPAGRVKPIPSTDALDAELFSIDHPPEKTTRSTLALLEYLSRVFAGDASLEHVPLYTSRGWRVIG